MNATAAGGRIIATVVHRVGLPHSEREAWAQNGNLSESVAKVTRSKHNLEIIHSPRIRMMSDPSVIFEFLVR